MKRILFYTILHSICIYTIAQSPTQFKSAIGKTFEKINDIDVFSNYIEEQGVVISEINEHNKGFAIISNGDHKIVLLTAYSLKGYKILAILDLGNIAKNEVIVLRECRLNKKKDNFIVAILNPKISQLYFTDIIKAWRLDSSNNSFKSIPTKGVDCLNEEFYNELDKH